MSTSSKTPSNATAKTASALRFWLLAIAGLLAAVALVALAAVSLWRKPPSNATLKAPRGTYHLSVAATRTTQQKGLGGRTSMPANTGMLFWFSDDDRRCFWMKDMRFPLDIIWLNAHKRVVYIQPNLSPHTYPQVYCPASPARYVVELSAGQARAAHILPGETLTF